MTNAGVLVKQLVWSSSPHGCAPIHHQHPPLAWLLKRLQGFSQSGTCKHPTARHSACSLIVWLKKSPKAGGWFAGTAVAAQERHHPQQNRN